MCLSCEFPASYFGLHVSCCSFAHNGEQGRNTTCLASFGFFPFYIDTLFPLSRFHSFRLSYFILNILLAILTPFRMSFTAAIYFRFKLHSMIH